MCILIRMDPRRGNPVGDEDRRRVGIEAVPMYNLTRGPAAGQLFHDKGLGNGYVVTLGGKRIRSTIGARISTSSPAR